MISGRHGAGYRRIPRPRDQADADGRAADDRARLAAAVRAELAPTGAWTVDAIEWRLAVSVGYDGLVSATAAIAPSGLVSVRSSAPTRGRALADVARELEEDLRGGIEDAHAGILGLAERIRAARGAA